MASRSSATDPAPRSLPDRVTVGHVRRPHGVRGEMVVAPLSDVPGRLAPGAEVTAFDPKGRRLGTLRVRTHRPFKDAALVFFEGVDDRDAAEALRFATLEIDRAMVPPAAEGSFYYFELVGCRCFDKTEGELGEVTRLSEDGGGHMLWVADGESELPIPLVNRFLVSVDVAAGRIDLELPPGLVEICRSSS